MILTRKERIMKEKEKKAKGWRRKVLGYTLVGAITANVILGADTENVLADTKQEVSNPNKKDNIIYTVVQGDTLYSLAKKYGVSIHQLQTANGLTSENIKINQILQIPLVAEVKQAQVQENPIEKITSATYTVSPGETLQSIARQFNISIAKIKADNNMSNNAILIGQKLMIKRNNLFKTSATISGAVDNFSIECMINEKPTVVHVAYKTASNFESISGEQVELVFYNANRPVLVSVALDN